MKTLTGFSMATIANVPYGLHWQTVQPIHTVYDFHLKFRLLDVIE